MTRNFHRWEVDPFFSAAEEVQDSADRLESVYRTWMHVKSVADETAVVEFHRRELSTALGTAKWQLEEFERAVSCVVVDDKDQAGDDAPARHRQFVDALQNQISTVETALYSSQDCRDLKTHQALQLEQKEKDDLELFLCGKRSSKEGDFCTSTSFKVDKAEELDPCSGVGSLECKNGVRPRFSTSGVNSDEDSRNPNSDTCLWSNEIGSSDKLLSDLREISIGNLNGRRVNEISKPVSDPTPEYFHHDRGEIYADIASGHQRSVSVGSGLNAWKSGSITDVRRKRRRLISVQIPSSRLSFWAIFAKARHPRKFRSGLKRWKDGDSNASDSEMLALMQGVHDDEQGNGTPWLEANINCIASDDLANDGKQHYRKTQQGLHMWQHSQYGLPSSRLVQIASAILVALGLVGLLSFHVTSSTL